MNKFVELTTFFKAINDELFMMLDNIYPKKSEQMGIFTPPSDGVEGSYTPYAGEHGTAKPLVTERKVFLLSSFFFLLSYNKTK